MTGARDVSLQRDWRETALERFTYRIVDERCTARDARWEFEIDVTQTNRGEARPARWSLGVILTDAGWRLEPVT